ncbi:hypothetical protein V491_05781, partial [Pseudogymnoascus sp. VKM F-3775]
EEDLGADDSRVVCATGATTVVDEQTEGDGEEGGAGDDEGLEVVNESHDEAGDETGDDGDETVQRDDAVALHVPCRVKHDGHQQRTPDAAVLEKAEGNHGVLAGLLPVDEGGDGEDADDERGDDVRCLPGLLDATGESEGYEDEREDGDDEDDAYDVELPEEFDGELAESKGLEGRLEGGESAGTVGAAACKEEGGKEGHATDGEDERPHADTPSPACVL